MPKGCASLGGTLGVALVLASCSFCGCARPPTPQAAPTTAPSTRRATTVERDIVLSEMGQVDRTVVVGGGPPPLALGGVTESRYGVWGLRDFALAGLDTAEGKAFYEKQIKGILIHGYADAGDAAHVLLFGNRVKQGESYDAAPMCLMIWDAAQGKEVIRFGEEVVARPERAAISRDGSRVLTAQAGNEMRLWDANTGKMIRAFNPARYVTSVALSADGSTALVGGSWTDENIELLDLKLNVKKQVFKGHVGGVSSAVFSPDGKRVLSAARDGTLRLWDVGTGKTLRCMKVTDHPLYTAIFSPDGLHAVSVDAEPEQYDVLYAPFNPGSTVRYWDLVSGRQLAVGKAPTLEVYSVAFTENVTHVLVSGRGPDFAAWPVPGREPRSAAWPVPEGLAGRTADMDRPTAPELPSAQVYCFESPQPSCVRFLGRDVVAAGADGNALHRWNVRTGEYLGAKKPAAVQQWPAVLAVSADGQYALSSSLGHVGKEAWQWELSDGLETQKIVVKGENSALAMTDDGAHVAVAASLETPDQRGWDVSIRGRVQKTEVAGTNTGLFKPEAMRFAPDSSVLAMLGPNMAVNRSELHLWNLRTGEDRIVPVVPPGAHAGLCFSADGRRLLYATAQDVFLVDVAGQRPLGRWAVPGRLHAVALSPDGRRFLTGGSDSNVRLWDIAQGRELAVFEDHRSVVTDVAFSPDGKLAASAGRDGTVRVWKLPE